MIKPPIKSELWISTAMAAAMAAALAVGHWISR